MFTVYGTAVVTLSGQVTTRTNTVGTATIQPDRTVCARSAWLVNRAIISLSSLLMLAAGLWHFWHVVSRGDTSGEGRWWHVYAAEWCSCILTVSRMMYLPRWFPLAFPAVFVFLSVLLLWYILPNCRGFRLMSLPLASSQLLMQTPRVQIANSPNSSQLGGTPYHSPRLHLGPCSSVGMRPWTDTWTRMTIIHSASSTTYAKCNN